MSGEVEKCPILHVRPKFNVFTLMINLFDCAKYFKSVSFLLYPTEVERLKCAMLGAFTVIR